MHANPLACKSKAPLNPILGETFQASKKDGAVIYLEQTSHHPPISNFYLIGPEKQYEMYGFAICNAQMTGMNSIKGWRDGKNFLKFKDETTYSYSTPDMRINGLIMGDRTVNFAGTFIIKDHKNNIECVSTFPYREVGKLESVKNSISGLFSSKSEEEPLDHFTIQISKIYSDTNKKDILAEGHGSWLGQVVFQNKVYI